MQQILTAVHGVHDELAARITSFRQAMEEDFADVVRRQDRLQADLNDVVRRVGSVEQAIIRLLNVTPLRAG